MLSTTVFNSQLPQLQSLSDKVVLKVVNFYSTLPVLDILGRLVNEQSTEYLRLIDAAQRDQAGIRMNSALRVTLEEIEKYQRLLADVQAALA